MKNTLLITASIAALMAGIGLASAQGVNREAPAAVQEQKAPEGQTDRQKSTAPQKTQKAMPAPTAQAPEKAKPGSTAQVPEMAKPAPTAQAPEKVKPAPTAQVPEQVKPAPTAQAPGRATPSEQTVGQSPGQAAAPKATGTVAPLSTEQHAKIRETLRGEKAERLSNVPFSISIGEEVPKTVHFYRLPARIVEYAPQYRDYDYFLVGDEILIVDPSTHRIVAVIPA